MICAGDTVMYNACLVDPHYPVPYMATGIWSTAMVNKPMEPVDAKAVQREKVDIFRQVVKACAHLVKEDEEDRREKIRRKHEPVVHAFTDKKSIGKKILFYFKHKTHFSKQSYFAGIMVEEKGQDFAIMKISATDGEKALVSSKRVWINDKPKFGNWKPLKLDAFKNQHVCARKVPAKWAGSDFQYQVRSLPRYRASYFLAFNCSVSGSFTDLESLMMEVSVQ